MLGQWLGNVLCPWDSQSLDLHGSLACVTWGVCVCVCGPAASPQPSPSTPAEAEGWAAVRGAMPLWKRLRQNLGTRSLA